MRAMAFLRLIVSSLALAAVSSAFQTFDVAEVSEGDVLSAQPRKYIVEFDSGSSSKAKRDEVLASESDIKVVKTFDSSLFSGASIESDSKSLDDLLQIPGVAEVWPNERVHLLAPTKRQTIIDEEAAKDFAVHWATGVDRLHCRGIFGEGVKVGIVDTGILYTHSALGGGFGPGFKVAGGWDFFGDGARSEEITPDADPLDQQGHGTHVAGIVGGNSTGGWLGVAPNATLFAYKVFGSDDGTDSSMLIEAFIHAYEDGMDIITASVGGTGGYSTHAWAVVADRIARQGVVVTIAAANYGAGGPYYASSGSSGESVIAVASAKVDVEANSTAPSYFTSWGGLYDLSVKPDIAAPGTNIFSTWIGGNDEFAVVSGTSMAAPYVAGVAALWIGANGGRDKHGVNLGRDLAMRIIASGDSLAWLNSDQRTDETYRAPTHQVGTGLLNARKIFKTATSLELQRFGLNDTLHFKDKKSVVVKNTGTEKIRYTFSVQDSAGFDMLAPYKGADPNETPRIVYRYDIKPKIISATVDTPSSFELAPGDEKKAEFVFHLPEGLNETAMPAYSGRVIIQGDNGDHLSVPYQGLAFNLKEELRNMFAGYYPTLRSTSSYSNKTTFTMDLSSDKQDFPKIFSKLKWGAKEMRLDLFGAEYDEKRDWKYPPEVGKHGYIGSAAVWEKESEVAFDPTKHDKENTNSFPLKEQPRNALVTNGYTTSHWWFGKLANGSYIETGNYTLRYAALIPFTDPTHDNSWSYQTWDIQILPTSGEQ